jgi:hypothetical protein
VEKVMVSRKENVKKCTGNTGTEEDTRVGGAQTLPPQEQKHLTGVP